MKTLFVILTIIIAIAACKSKDTTSALITRLDPNFEKYLVDKKIDKDGVVNGTINQSDAKIEYFADLKYLNCSENQLTDLDVSKNIY